MGENRSGESDQSRGEVTATHRRYQFYGRRKGHALRRQHLQLVETLLPKLRFDPAAGTFNQTRETWLEIGFGGGEHLAHLAERHPDIRFIGAEPFVNGVAKLLALIADMQLDNILIHDSDARELFEALPDAALARIYLLYPDPWPKVRHHKRRLVNAENLAQIQRLLRPGGELIFASDSEDYVAWTLEHIHASGGFSGSLGDPNKPPENWVVTRYEQKARKAGRVSRYLRFRKAD